MKKFIEPEINVYEIKTEEIADVGMGGGIVSDTFDDGNLPG